MNEHIPDIETYIKRLNWYLQEHYPANKKITAEEWNALFLALINQGNAQEDTLAKICNEYLPLQIEKINTLVDTTNEHEARIAQLRTDTNKALKDSNYAVITADTALNQVVEKMGTVAYINNVLAPSLHYTRDPQAQLDDTAQGIINLQSQIDLMEQNTNVADVVGTFVDLVNYDKSKITANDIVEVLQDETRANADTYYRLVENAWVYIGKLGSYYTRGESDALLAEKINYADYKDTLSFAENERQKSKNLFNKALLKKGCYIYVTGGYENAANYMTFEPISVTPNSTITVSCNGFTFNSDCGFVFFNNGVYVGYLSNGATVATVPANANQVIYDFYKVDITKDDLQYAQLEYGSTATDYQPYYGQITHSGDKEIEFAESERQKSKNLFNINNTILDYSLNLGESGQQLNMASTKAESYGRCCTNINSLIKVKPNTQYIITNNSTFKCSVGQINASRLVVTETGWKTDSTLTITTTSTTEYVAFNFGKTDNSKITSSEFSDFLLSHIQVEEGSVATDYVPYYGQISHTSDKEIEFARNEYKKSKNLLNATTSETTFGNMTFSADTSNMYFNGSYTDADRCMFNSWALKKGTYTLNIEYISGSITRFENILFYLYKGGSWTQYSEVINLSSSNKAGSVSFTLDEDVNDARLALYQNLTNTMTNCVFKYQIVEGTNSDFDFQPYSGQITHNGDPAVEFAESERQKSKNLLQNTLEGFQLENKGYELIIYEKNQNVSYPLNFYVKGNTINYPLAPEGALFSFTYSDGSVSYVTGTYFQGDTKQHLNYTFDGSKELEKITLLNWCKCVGTVEFAQLEENDHFTDYQLYNGEIIHEKKLNEIVNGKYPIDINACTTYDQVYNLLQNAAYGQCGIGVNHTSAIKSLLPAFPTNASYVDCVANVIKNKYTASINIYAIRFTGCPFGLNQPIYYCDVFYDGENTIVTGWYKPETVELIYDKDTKNTIGGKPYTAGIKSGTVINHDFSQYKKLILTVYRNNVGCFDYEINLEYLDYSELYGGAGITYSFQAQDNYFVYSSARISADKQTMVYVKSGYTETFFETMVSTNDVPILRIKGVK